MSTVLQILALAAVLLPLIMLDLREAVARRRRRALTRVTVVMTANAASFNAAMQKASIAASVAASQIKAFSQALQRAADQ